MWFKLVSARSATKEMTTSLNEPMRPTLDEALEYVIGDELVEVSLVVHSKTSLLATANLVRSTLCCHQHIAHVLSFWPCVVQGTHTLLQLLY